MKYYCIKQHDITDCGVACLATISKQNGYKIGITKISQIDSSISSIENEKNTSLNNLKVQQITSLEEQIKSLDNNHDSLEARQSLLNDQLNILDGKEKKRYKRN